MSYNVENLFDTIHAEGKLDADFTPTGEYHWTGWRLRRKLRELSKVIVAVDSVRPVDVIGLCEVENDSVMTMLTQRTMLRRIGYRYVMTDSPDPRGIDVALVYNPLTFALLEHRTIRPSTSTPTRDILTATGVNRADTISLYMVHLPSRKGGGKASRNRLRVIDALLADIDSVSTEHPARTFVVMGDFNDELKGTKLRPFSQRGFIDETVGKHPGTYKYQGEWSTIDHVLVRGTESATFRHEAAICNLPFLLESDSTVDGVRPFRTYLGPVYKGGISDHLPVLLRLQYP